MTKLGDRQMAFLEALLTHNVWRRNGGWTMDMGQVAMTKLVRTLEARVPRVPIWATFDGNGVERVERDDGLFPFICEQRELRAKALNVRDERMAPRNGG